LVSFKSTFLLDKSTFLLEYLLRKNKELRAAVKIFDKRHKKRFFSKGKKVSLLGIFVSFVAQAISLLFFYKKKQEKTKIFCNRKGQGRATTKFLFKVLWLVP